jgi:hypothetical protein
MAIPIQTAYQEEISRIAESITEVICSLTQKESTEFLRLLLQRVDQNRAELAQQTDPSDIGAPAGAPKPIPVPHEVIAEALNDFNEAEIIEAIQELRKNGGYQLKDILPRRETAIKSSTAPQ